LLASLQVDPNETNRITFSNAADRLNSIGRRSSAAGGSPGKGARSSKSKSKKTPAEAKPGRNL
jgi:hypothetical protein